MASPIAGATTGTARYEADGRWLVDYAGKTVATREERGNDDEMNGQGADFDDTAVWPALNELTAR
jgi:hypothetical protein